MDQPLVSFIIAAYNAEGFVEDAIRSALAQVDVNLEVIVIDDASQDGTPQRIEAMAKIDNRITIIRQQNAGPSAARNAGLKSATGAWIAILDADDIIRPERSIRLIEAADELGSDIVCDNIIRFLDGDPISIISLPRMLAHNQPLVIGLKEYFEGNRMFGGDDNLGYLKPMIRRSFLTENRLEYDEDLRTGEDFDLCMRCLLYKARYLISPEAFYLYRVSPMSLSRSLTEEHIIRLIYAYDYAMRNYGMVLDEDTRNAGDRYCSSLYSGLEFVNFRTSVRHRQWGKMILHLFSLQLSKTIVSVFYNNQKRRWRKRAVSHF